MLPTGTRRKVCKACRREAVNRRNRANPEKVKQQRDAWIAKNLEHFKNYHANYRTLNAETIAEKKRALWAANRERYSANRKAYRQAFPDLVRAQVRESYYRNRENKRVWWKKYFESNKERIYAVGREYRLRNIDRRLASFAEYVKNNRERFLALSRKRYATKLNATPPWFSELDELTFIEAYDLARLRRDMYGFAWHVDHVIPLQGKTVCGLHVHNNIAVIPAVENLRKRNRYE